MYLVQNGGMTPVSNSETLLYSYICFHKVLQPHHISQFIQLFPINSPGECSHQLCDLGRSGMTIFLFTKFRDISYTQSQQAMLLSPLSSMVHLPTKPSCFIKIFSIYLVKAVVWWSISSFL